MVELGVARSLEQFSCIAMAALTAVPDIHAAFLVLPLTKACNLVPVRLVPRAELTVAYEGLWRACFLGLCDCFWVQVAI